MKILILSWRDIKHPYGGGAELLSHEMAKRWADCGHEVTHFSASFPGAKSSEVIDGITYLRAGGWYNVHIKAFLRIITGRFDGFDVIVDEVHGIPFFSKLYSKTPVICLACEVAKEIWDQMYPFPLNIIGKMMEKIYLFLYRDVKFLTISDSTKGDLVANGIKSKNITILPMGFTYSLPDKLPSKNKTPTLIFLGRLAKSKGVPDAIKAFSFIQKKFPKARLLVVGRGVLEYESFLHEMVKKLGLEKQILFKGFVGEEEKFNLLSQSHLILVPSVREGWGLIVPEANLVGTPAIVYNVPGLRDVTKNNRNGVVVKAGSPKSLADAAIKLLSADKEYQQLSKSSQAYAKSLSWDDTAKAGFDVLEVEANHSVLTDIPEKVEVGK